VVGSCRCIRRVMSQQRAQGQPRQGVLNFITFGESPQPTSTRAIRSHAAKAGWKLRKNSRSLAAAAQSGGPLLGPTTEAAPTDRLAPPRHRNLPAVPSWPDHDTVPRVVPSLASSTSHTLSSGSSDSTPSSDSPPDTAMDPTAEDTDFAEPGFIEDDDEDDDLEDVDSDVSPFAGTDTTRPQCSSVISPHQLGSTHDPFSQFPVRWEEAFGPLVQFCKYPSLAHLPLGSRWAHQFKSDPTVT
jgi:hypothetical protein